jgi:hypothetical protein
MSRFFVKIICEPVLTITTKTPQKRLKNTQKNHTLHTLFPAPINPKKIQLWNKKELRVDPNSLQTHFDSRAQFDAYSQTLIHLPIYESRSMSTTADSLRGSRAQKKRSQCVHCWSIVFFGVEKVALMDLCNV